MVVDGFTGHLLETFGLFEKGQKMTAKLGIFMGKSDEIGFQGHIIPPNSPEYREITEKSVDGVKLTE